MSFERLRRRLILEAALFRLLGDSFGAVATVILAVGRAVDEMGQAPFYLEQNAARLYRDLTGIDLGQSTGEESRFQENLEFVGSEDSDEEDEE